MTLLVAAVAAFAAPSCVIGGDEPWDAEDGTDTDTDTELGGDSDSDGDSDVYDGDGGNDGSVDEG